MADAAIIPPITVEPSKLLIQFAGYSREKSSWNKEGRKHERDSNHRPRHFTHCLKGGITRRHSFFDMTLNCLHNDNRVVHHETYG
jgi:hypothetical protein